jgi:DNA-binding transcriptional LysR family regulator
MDQLRSMRVFSQVITEGSFAGAARVLDLAPAVVTRTVADLEAHLGARLLNRTTRKLALTDTGAAYLDRARSILLDVEEADGLAGSSTQLTKGSLRVLCPPAFAVHQLAPNLPRFRASQPNITLELSAPGPVVTADEHFDISILSIGEQVLEGDFVVRKLAKSAFVLCAAPSYIARQGKPGQPAALEQFEGVLPAVAALRHGITLYRLLPGGSSGSPKGGPDSVLVPAGKIAMTTNHIDMMLASGLAGIGIVALPSFVAQVPLREGRLTRVLPEWCGVTLTIYAAVPSRKYLPARTRVFLDFLVQTFGGTDDDPWLKHQGVPRTPRSAGKGV